MTLTPMPVRANPFSDESLMGFALRLSEMNHMESIQWLSYIFHTQKISHLTLHHLPTIAWLFGSHVVNSPANCIFSSRDGGHTVFHTYGHIIRRSFLLRMRRPQVCAACLIENNYVRKSWDFSMASGCPFHCLQLVDRCEKCSKNFSWNRPGISLCKCGYDIRKSQQSRSSEESIAFSGWLQQRISQSAVWRENSSHFEPVLSMLDPLSIDSALRIVWATGIKKFPDDRIDVGTGSKALSIHRADECVGRSFSRLKEALVYQNIGEIRSLFSESILRSLIDETDHVTDQVLISQLLLLGKRRENPKASLLHLNPLSQMRLF
ncbi:TniQ family protein [Undibacterium sp. RuTC16W]|uniref:TniQ family protein n=1 Tax=Undibacterium sp. RuTC16W TaxID=3413048 RepID=UPI003BF01305